MWKILYPWCWWAIFIAFTIFEIIPLIMGQGKYTLSDYIWRLEEINRGWTALRFYIGATCLFLFLHLTFGILH